MTNPPPPWGSDPDETQPYRPTGDEATPSGPSGSTPPPPPGPAPQDTPPTQQYPTYQPYGDPAGGYGAANPYGGAAPYQAPQPTNGMAIASLVVSIASVVVCCGAAGIVGAILGHVAKKQIRQGRGQGDGMALAGIIVGWIAFALFVIGVVLYAVLIGWAISEGESNGCDFSDPNWPDC